MEENDGCDKKLFSTRKGVQLCKRGYFGMEDKEWERIIKEFKEESSLELYLKIKNKSGLPGWLSGKESACQCRKHGFNIWVRRIPHASEQLSWCATTTKPVLWRPGTTTTEAHNALEPLLCSKRSLRNEKPSHYT